ncbi:MULTISPECIES: putative leader peptide [Streptomyces]|uniref:putative leader peptide n=1 Tax=Streptomyces TaxID=1883 RepID=UPI0030794478
MSSRSSGKKWPSATHSSPRPPSDGRSEVMVLCRAGPGAGSRTGGRAGRVGHFMNGGGTEPGCPDTTVRRRPLPLLTSRRHIDLLRTSSAA